MRSVITGLAPSRLIMASLFLVVFGLLAACGTAQGPGPQAPSCGALALPNDPPYVLPAVGQRVEASEQCFVDAYHRCKAMSLQVSDFGTDTSTAWTFTILPQGARCQIEESEHFSSANFGGSEHVTMGTCQGLTETTDALVLVRCQGQDFSIPRGEECGYVRSQTTPAAAKAAETCFAEDYQHCFQAELHYESGSEGRTEALQISASCQVTLVPNDFQPGIPCASLTQEADGLHIVGCGNRGAILVPAHP